MRIHGSSPCSASTRSKRKRDIPGCDFVVHFQLDCLGFNREACNDQRSQPVPGNPFARMVPGTAIVVRRIIVKTDPSRLDELDGIGEQPGQELARIVLPDEWFRS